MENASFILHNINVANQDNEKERKRKKIIRITCMR